MTTTTTRQSPPATGQGVPDGTPQSETDALASVEGAEPVALPTPRGMVRGVLSTLAQPGPLARETARLGRDTARILRGTDEIAPEPRDRRFADPAWSLHPGYRRLAQSYLAVTGAVDRLLADYEAGGADWRDIESARFVVNAFTSALAPTNTLLGNPAALKRAFDTAGLSVLRGTRNMLRDLVRNGGLPTQVDRSAFTVGEDL